MMRIRKIAFSTICILMANLSILPISALENDTSQSQELLVEKNKMNVEGESKTSNEIYGSELEQNNRDNLNYNGNIEENVIDREMTEDADNNLLDAKISSSITYQGHVQDLGWQGNKNDGETLGTIGQELRLEGLRIQMNSNFPEGDIEYSSHIQNIGWQNWVKNGAVSGTEGKSLRLEALKIKLNGQLANEYDVYYRGHVQNFGWLGWAKNGNVAGSMGYNYRLEAVEIRLVNKGDTSLENGLKTFHSKKIQYKSHVQNIGWEEFKKDGEMSGTVGKNFRLEGIRIQKDFNMPEGDIEYSSHIQNSGWQKEVKNGELSGTEGKNLQLEAIKINLTGQLEKEYDVYYRVHAQNFGWLGWAKNGASAGTVGYSYRLEAIEIKLVDKGDISLEDGLPEFKSKNINYQSYLQDKGWQDKKYNGETSGTTGKKLQIEGIKINKNEVLSGGDIEYTSHVQNIGWQNWVKNGELSGTEGKDLRLEAIKIRLTGQLAEEYNVYYRVHAQEFGWLGWTKNGEIAGTMEFDYRLEAIEIKLIKKGEDSPDISGISFYDGIDCKRMSSVTNVEEVNLDSGTFKVSVSNTQTVFPIEQVIIDVWCLDDKSDSYKYVLYKQENDLYSFDVDLKNHKYHNGKYKIETKIKTKYDLSAITNSISIDVGMVNFSTTEYLGNGLVKLIYSNIIDVIDVKAIIFSSKNENDFKEYNLSLESNGVYSTTVDGRSFNNTGDFNYQINANEFNSGNQISTIGAFKINRVDYTPIYYSQKDPRWKNIWYGEYQFGPTGCNPTSIAMALSALSNKVILPTQVADYLYHSGMYNNTGAGAGSLAVKYAVEYFGYKSDAIKSHDDLVEQLKMNKIVCGAVGRGIFVNGNYTHEIVLYGYSNGKTYVRDPLSERMNGWYNINDIWNQQSKDPYDMVGGAVFYSAYD